MVDAAVTAIDIENDDESTFDGNLSPTDVQKDLLGEERSAVEELEDQEKELPVLSEEDVQLKLNKAAEYLYKEDWDQRINGLQILEDLVKQESHATLPRSFPSHVMGLQDVLQKQILDRRSQVSRQACHVVSVMSQYLGTKIETFLVGLLETLFKAQIMSIQVVAESSDSACKAIVQYCPSSRLIPLLCSTSRLDKHVRLRLAAASYVAQAIEEWDSKVYERHNEMIQTTLISIVEDASNEVRSVGKKAFVTYFEQNPAGVSEILRNLGPEDYNLHRKLTSAITQVHGKGAVSRLLSIEESFSGEHKGSGHTRSISASFNEVQSTQHMAGNHGLRISKLSIPVIKDAPTMDSERGPVSARSYGSVSSFAEQTMLPRRPASAATTPSPHQRARMLQSEKNEKNGYNSQHHIVNGMRYGTAQRIIDPSGLKIDDNKKPIDTDVQLHGTERLDRGKARRVSQVSNSLHAGLNMTSSRMSPTNMPPTGACASMSQLPEQLQHERNYGRPATCQSTISELIANLQSPGIVWRSRIELFGNLQACIEDGRMTDIENYSELPMQMIDAILDGLGDAHHKVTAAALEVLTAALRSPTLYPLFEQHIDRLLPVLLTRAADAKEQIRHLSAVALLVIVDSHNIDIVSTGIEAAFRSIKSPKAICCILDFWSEMIIAVDMEDINSDNDISAPKRTKSTSVIQNIVSKCIDLALHRNIEVRNSALHAASVSYSHGFAPLVDSAIALLTDEQQESIRRGLSLLMAVREPSSGFRGPNGMHDRTLTLESHRNISMDASMGIRKRSSSPSAKQRRPSRGHPHSPSDAHHTTTRHMGMKAKANKSIGVLLNSFNSQNGTTLSSNTRPKWRSPGSITSEHDLGDDQHEESTCSSPTWEEAVTSPNPIDRGERTTMSSSRHSEYELSPTEIGALSKKLSSHPDIDSMSKAALFLSCAVEQADVETITSAFCQACVKVLSDLYDAGKAQSSIVSDTAPQEAALEYFTALKSVFHASPASRVVKHSALSLLKALLRASSYGPRGKFSTLAEQSGNALLKIMKSPVDVLSVLINFLPCPDERPPFDSETSWSVAMTLRMARDTLSELESEQVNAVLKMVVPSMRNCYNSANPEIRKAASDCLVCVFNKAGDRMWYYLDDLTDVQKRLIRICIDNSSN